MVLIGEGAFTLRRDQNGLRPVYNLGNELGDCPYHCTFCGVGRSPKVTPEWNIAEFDRQHAAIQSEIDGPYHPLIYNQGNVTSPAEFSRRTLDHILRAFEPDPRVIFISLNSRERLTTNELLDSLAGRGFRFPIHFILGVESLSANAPKILGKDTRGELERFISKLARYNRAADRRQPLAGYTFGLDASIVFLPELYLQEGQSREGRGAEIAGGLLCEVKQLLTLFHPTVPVEINLHPYYEVASLPWKPADLESFMLVLPLLQVEVNRHNASTPGHPTHLFVGIEGTGYEGGAEAAALARWKTFIESFNQSGRCPWEVSPSDPDRLAPSPGAA